MTRITASKLFKSVVQVARENPSRRYINPSDGECYYTSADYDDGQVRRCIVGEGLATAGVDVESTVNGWLGSVDDMFYDPSVVSEDFSEAVERLEPYLGEDDGDDEGLAVSALLAVQVAQDNGATWGEAVLKALDVYPEAAKFVADDTEVVLREKA